MARATDLESGVLARHAPATAHGAHGKVVGAGCDLVSRAEAPPETPQSAALATLVVAVERLLAASTLVAESVLVGHEEIATRRATELAQGVLDVQLFVRQARQLCSKAQLETAAQLLGSLERLGVRGTA